MVVAAVLPPLAVTNWNFLSLVQADAGPDSVTVVAWVTLEGFVANSLGVQFGTDGSLVVAHDAECPPELSYVSNYCQRIWLYRSDGSPRIAIHDTDSRLFDVMEVDGEESIVFQAWNTIDQDYEWRIAPLREPIAGVRVVAEPPEPVAVVIEETWLDYERVAAWGPDEARFTWIDMADYPYRLRSHFVGSEELLFAIELSESCQDRPTRVVDIGTHVLVNCGRVRGNSVDGDRALVVDLTGDTVEQWRLPVTG